MLKHFYGQSLGETDGHCVGVSEHCVTLPPPHQVNGVWVHPCHEKCRNSPHAEQTRGDVRLRKTDGQSGGTDNGICFCGDSISLHLAPPIAILDDVDGDLTGVTVELKLCRPSTHGFHRTYLGVDRSSLSDQLALDTVILCSK